MEKYDGIFNEQLCAILSPTSHLKTAATPRLLIFSLLTQLYLALFLLLNYNTI